MRTKAEGILVSSLAGHANILVKGLREKCSDAGLKDILLYIGGHLVLHREDWEVTERTFLDMGFDRVYEPFTLPDTVIGLLRSDLGREQTGEVSA